MLKQLCVLLLLGTTAAAQCPADFSASRQSDIDNFKTTYPKCTNLPGSIQIWFNSNINSLKGLANLKSVGGDVYLAGLPNLRSLEGLENLETVGGMLYLGSLQNLQSLEPLNKLTKVSGDVRLSYLGSVQSFNGLRNLSSPIQGLHIAVTGVNSLAGLEKIKSFTALSLYDNNRLSDISSIGNAQITRLDELTITLNESLSKCAIRSLCQAQPIYPVRTLIVGNATGCNSRAEMRTACETALPVTLVEFSGKMSEDAVALRWKTSEETNSEKYEIQHSADARNWEVVGEMASEGNSSVGIDYTFLHESPVSANNYYRLRCIDQDQTYAFSAIISVFNENNPQIAYPNPANTDLQLDRKQIPDFEGYQLFNVAGQVVLSGSEIPTQGISLAQVAAGSYILKITRKTGGQVTQRVTVAR